MARRRRKVSFILQFADASRSSKGRADWRATLEEVESGERHTFTSYEDLAIGLAKHGVHLPHDKPANQICEACLMAAKRVREAH